MKTRLLFMLIILSFCFIHCEKSLEPENADSQVILQYKFMQGWTGQITTINIYGNGVITDTTGVEKQVGFSKAEWRQLNNFLAHFRKIKSQYKPSDGIFCDVDNHRLVKTPESKADTIAIYEPIRSEQIPAELQNVIAMLKEKLE